MLLWRFPISWLIRLTKIPPRYADKIKEGIIPTDNLLHTYVPGQNSSDSVTSPTELYFAKRGSLYTYVNGKRYDTTHLHIRGVARMHPSRQDLAVISTLLPRSHDCPHLGYAVYLEGRTM